MLRKLGRGIRSVGKGISSVAAIILDVVGWIGGTIAELMKIFD